MKTIGANSKIGVSSDTQGIACQAGGLLLIETLQVSGLKQGLSHALAGWRRPRAVHDPGKITGDPVVALALGAEIREVAYDADGRVRDGAWVAEPTGMLDRQPPQPPRGAPA